MRRRSIVMCAALFACLSAPAQAQIVYSADGRLYEIGADGSGRSLFTAPTSRQASDSQPQWSPDGSQLVAVHEGDPDDLVTLSRIDLLSVDGSSRERIIPVERGTLVSSPRWSPDGDQLVFARASESIGPGEHFMTSIVVTDLDGNERTLLEQRLDRRLSSVGIPEWSPDGTEILYSTFRVGRSGNFHTSIRVAPLDGGPTELFRREAYWPVFSPDGSRIAFISVADRNGHTCGSDECSYNGELYVTDAEGENARRLTRGKGNEAAPAWAPDGSRIAFSSDRNYPHGGLHEIYSVEPDGGCLTWLTNGTADSSSPTWHPATASTDPGACGETRRPPRFETNLDPVRRFAAAPPLWLGRSYRGLLLSDVDRGGGLYLSYFDCGRYRPSDCPRGIDLTISSVCARFSPVSDLSGHADRRRRALVQPFTPSSLRALTGGLDVQINGGRAPRAFRDLRPFPRESAVDRLRPPTLPGWLVREVERAARLRERLGSIAAVAERMNLPHRTVRRRLATAKTLDDFGQRVRTKRCPRPFYP